MAPAIFQKRALGGNTASGSGLGKDASGSLGQWMPAIRLFGRVWFTVLVLSLICVLAWDMNHDREQRASKVEASIDRVLLAWQAGAEARNFPDVSEVTKLGKQFILFDVIMGGIVLSQTGDILASFGQIPELNWQSIHLDNVLYVHNTNERTIDVSLMPLKTGLAHELILRIPGPGHKFSKLKMGASKTERVVRDIIFAVFLASAVSILMLFFFMRPHWELQRAAANSASAKYKVDSHRLKWNRKDTLGVTAKAIDTLIARLHYVRESELAPWKHAFMKTGLPILKINPNGRLSEANNAAAKLFEMEQPARLKELDFIFTTIPDNKHGSPLEICQRQSDGHFQGQVMLQTSKGNAKVCFADITLMDSTEHRKSAGVQVVLVDATNFFTRLVTKEEEASRLSIAQAESKRNDLLMRRQLEAFSFLATPAVEIDQNPHEAATFVSMERLINEWYQESVANGASKDVLEHSALEAVSGDPELIRNVVRQAYSMMYTLSGEVKPQINISSKLVKGGMAEFIIEQIPNLNGKKTPIPEEILSWSHNFDALKKALEEAQGQVFYFDATIHPIKVIIHLPAFRHSGARVSTNGGATAMSADEYDAMKKAS
ncbi:MAG: hypothetical protein AB8B94_04745 [Hyphomicrobiales bacterium]